MRKAKRPMLFTVLVLTAVMFTSTAYAVTDEVPPKNYVQGNLGAFGPANDLDDADFDTGLNGAISYGRYLTDNVKIEGMIDYSFGDRDERYDNPAAGERYDQDDYLYTTGLLVTLKGEIPVGDLDLYCGAGLGIYGVWIYTDIDSNRHGKVDGDDFDTVFGVHVSLGANYNITDYFYIGLEGRYRWTGDADLYDDVAGYIVQYEGNLNGYTVAMNVGFRF